MSRNATIASGAALLGVVGLGLWPLRYALGVGPMSREASALLAGSATGRRFQPLAELSLSLAGPGPQRLIDLGLHGLSALLLALLLRRLRPQSSPWIAVMAAAIFIAHPVHDFAVVDLAARGFLLALPLALGALCLLGGALRWPQVVGAALLLLLASAADRTGTAAALAAVALVVRKSAPQRWSMAAVVALPVGVMALVASLGSPSMGPIRPDKVAGAVWVTLAPLANLQHNNQPPLALAAAAAAVGALLLAGGWWESRRDGLRSGLVLWLFGLTALLALDGSWLPRRAYPLAAPYAMLLALGLSELMRAGRLRALALPAITAVISLLISSPLVRGVNPERRSAWKRTTATLVRLQRALDGLPAGASHVDLVMPRFSRPAARALGVKTDGFGVFDTSSLRTAAEVVVAPLFTYRLRARAREPLARVGAKLVLPPRTRYIIRQGRVRSHDVDWPLVAAPRKRPGQAQYIYIDDGRQGELLPYQPSIPSGPPNVLWIVWDTVRSDHLSLYDYPLPTTPFLAQWATQGRVFDDCISAGSTTVPAHAAMFTGLLPTQHGADNQDPVLPSSVPTLAELLTASGYGSYAFVGNPHLTEDGDLVRGFQVVDNPWRDPWRTSAQRIAYQKVDPRDVATSAARKLNDSEGVRGPTTKAGSLASEGLDQWLVQGREHGQPFFAFFNYMEAHRPYLPGKAQRDLFMSAEEQDYAFTMDRSWPAMWSYSLGLSEASEQDLSVTSKLYDAGLRELDDLLPDMLDMLEAHGAADNTFVVLVADHGESLGDHHSFDHQYSVYDELMRVPLVLWGPGITPGRDPSPVNNLDLFTTLLAITGVAGPDDGVQRVGVDLRQPLSKRVRLGEYPVWMRAGLDRVSADHPGFDRSPWEKTLRAFYTDSHKLIQASDGSAQLYALSDVGELHDLAGSEPERVRVLQQALEDYLAPLERPGAHKANTDNHSLEGEGMQSELEALGYVDGG